MRPLEHIDWNTWQPVHHATLTLIIQNGQILLIRKKRGLGAGKINGPGGKQAPDESILQCAIRETQEELCITPTGMRFCGENRFQFADGYSIHVHTFVADGFEGIPTETDEAIPLWFDLDKIPYDEMWQDDILWIPPMLKGHSFQGRYLFDGDVMLDHDIAIGSAY